MTNHFNQLSEAEAERLAILIEECAEVSHCACKILRHGYDLGHPKKKESNREALERELGDLFHAARRLIGCEDARAGIVEERARSKPKRIQPYLHHQG